jgi:YesN/AraC family two-component response regulator
VLTTILIVEDHDLMRQVLQEWITLTFPGYHVIEAANGEDAVAIVQVCSPHLIVMDIDLPGINGIQVR